MSKLTDKARSMGFLYVHGPVGVKGNWNESAKAAGYTRPPREDTKVVWDYITEFSKENDSNRIELEQLLAQLDGLSWEQLAEKVKPILAKVAMGTMYATAAQISALKELLNRGKGKVGAKAQDESEGVVILPMLNTGKVAAVCPVCKSRVENENYLGA